MVIRNLRRTLRGQWVIGVQEWTITINGRCMDGGQRYLVQFGLHLPEIKVWFLLKNEDGGMIVHMKGFIRFPLIEPCGRGVQR